MYRHGLGSIYILLKNDCIFLSVAPRLGLNAEDPPGIEKLRVRHGVRKGVTKEHLEVILVSIVSAKMRAERQDLSLLSEE